MRRCREFVNEYNIFDIAAATVRLRIHVIKFRYMRPLILHLVGVQGALIAFLAMLLASPAWAAESSEAILNNKALSMFVIFDDKQIQSSWEQYQLTKSGVQEGDFAGFKKIQLARLKQDALSAVPRGEVAILRDYEELPIMYLRFSTQQALEILLAQPSVKNAYESRQYPIPRP